MEYNSEPRRIIKFGNSSYIISLPKPWIEKNKIKKGDLVYVGENVNNELIINTSKKSTKSNKSITINIDNKDFGELRREVASAYINNHNEIILTGKDMAKRNSIIAKALQEKIGIEIIEQTPEQTIAKDVLDFEAISLHKIIKRMDLMIKSMFEDLITGFGKEKFKEWVSKEINQTDSEVNKLYFLIWKIARKCQEDPSIVVQLKTNGAFVSNAQWLSLQLEYIGDEIKRISKLLVNFEFKKDEKEKLCEILNSLEGDYAEIMGAYYKDDKEMARKISGKKEKLLDSCSALLRVNTSEMGVIAEKLKAMCIGIHNISKLIAY